MAVVVKIEQGQRQYCSSEVAMRSIAILKGEMSAWKTEVSAKAHGVAYRREASWVIGLFGQFVQARRGQIRL